MSSQSALSDVISLRLSQKAEGGVKELWATSFPFMLSALSTALMLFLDRLFLANYSTDAMNVSVSAGATATTFIWGCFIFAGITEVFVTQYVGAGLFQRLGEPVWQMIWFALMSTVFFWPMAIWGANWFYADAAEGPLAVNYFRILMLSGPLTPLIGALSAFYIGQRSLGVVTLCVVFANIVNVVLDVVLIFGIPGIVPELGLKGAAIATGCAQVMHAIILATLFLRPYNRINFGTGRWRFNTKQFLKCLRIGSPHALAQTLEPFAWALYFTMMMAQSKEHITVVGICQSVYVLFGFIVDGINKGAATILGNLIGAKKWKEVRSVLSSGIKLYGFIFLIVGFFLVVYPDPLMNLFLSPKSNELGLAATSLDAQGIIHLKGVIRVCFLWTCIYLFFDGIRYLLMSYLTVSGDTLFLSIASSSSVWMIGLLPIYIFIAHLGYSIATATLITVVYNAVTCAVFYWRIRKEKWKAINLCD